MRSALPLLVALVLGLLGGFAIRLSNSAMLASVASDLAPIGALWLAAMKMTLIPLVFSLVAGSVGSLIRSRSGGRTMATSALVLGSLLLLATALGLSASALLLKLWPTSTTAHSALAAAPVPAATAAPSLLQQLEALAPDNVVAAAAQGRLMQVVVFALAFGWAAATIAPDRSRALSTLLAALGDTMMRIVQAVLIVAPPGVFVLALEAGLSAGVRVAALLAQMVACSLILSGVAILVCHLIARVWGGVGWRRFARAAAVPQALAAGSCSSMATLPALIAAGETGLRLDPALSGAVLPLAVSTFRFGTAVSSGMTALYAASAAGLHLGVSQYLVVAFAIVLTNAGVVGLPGAAVMFAVEAPVFQAVGAPLSFLPLWIAVFAIPDILITVCNVTADLTAATVVARMLGQRSPAALAVAPT